VVFELFTEEARHVTVRAQEEALSLGHNYIGTEHVLLGLCRVKNRVPSPVLEGLDVTADRVRANVVRIDGSGEPISSGEQIPFTPGAMKVVLDRSLQESRSMGHDFIGPEHLLLALLRDEDDVAVRILRELSVDPDMVRRRVEDSLRRPRDDPSAED
jgi:ATP-dependent Clp protease ATP-binding subunit ClpC